MIALGWYDGPPSVFEKSAHSQDVEFRQCDRRSVFDFLLAILLQPGHLPDGDVIDDRIPVYSRLTEVFLMMYALDAVCTLIVLAAILGLALHLIGRSLPAEHRHVCTLRLNQPPEPVYGLIADLANWPAWDTGVTGIDALPNRHGQECIRMHMGRNKMVLLRTRNEPPSTHEMTIEDEGANIFSGQWLHEIKRDGQGCLVTLTENGTIRPTIPRAIARRFADPTLYLKRHLMMVAKHFGEEPRVERV